MVELRKHFNLPAGNLESKKFEQKNLNDDESAKNFEDNFEKTSRQIQTCINIILIECTTVSVIISLCTLYLLFK